MHESPTAWPRFRGATPRILLLTSQYFLIGELEAACKRLGVEHLLLDLGAKEMDLDQFVSAMTGTFETFRPDFVLTVNHLGVDREGILAELLNRYGLPLASWFVDNPHLILGVYKHLLEPRAALFTWDLDTVEPLRAMGFKHVFHLPLGADPARLRPHRTEPVDAWRAPISFVGNSMLTKTLLRARAANPSEALFRAGMEAAKAFARSDAPLAGPFMAEHFPEVRAAYKAFRDPERELAFETFVTWQATLLYRLDCVSRILPFEPLIVGDTGWQELFSAHSGWRYHPELSYYDDLPDFYPASDVNFNCTSRQMTGAANQRVFDVPCCNGFLLTDRRHGIEDLFEPGSEIVCYATPDEIPTLAERYMKDPAARERVASAARRRVLAEHTYDHRMRSLMETMRATFA
ncbi:LmbE family protein [Pseudodesulfovibrio mercurii]|uniref:LmbE family protein n=1 Tax=Pseudodesulfovibrio mercurii TaxID=641491 RepID=F0JJ61_9BACT|nr:glycosyltransferase [Pseudodesulfovibrio mercurii]EGB15960.1 LmbE family protein [Pseudodesulfovibrio mercurii]